MDQNEFNDKLDELMVTVDKLTIKLAQHLDNMYCNCKMITGMDSFTETTYGAIHDKCGKPMKPEQWESWRKYVSEWYDRTYGEKTV